MLKVLQGSKWITRILIMILCMSIISNIAPIGNYSMEVMEVEAASVLTDYSMYIQKDLGLVKLTRETSYSYTGLNETTELTIEAETGSGGSRKVPTVADVPNATKLNITWTVGAEGKVIKIDDADGAKDSTKASIRRIGPGVASVTCNLSWVNSSNTILESLNITSSIKIPADINKSRVDVTNGRAPFTKIIDGGEDEGNTVLMFNINQGDILSETDPIIRNTGKKVILSYNTKSTSNSVNWKSDNTDVAVIHREIDPNDSNNEIVTIIPKKAGATLITASSAISESISDSFYAVVMPTFTYNTDVKQKIIPSNNVESPDISNLKTIEVKEGTYIETNALNTRDLIWNTYLFSDQTKTTDLLKMDTREGSGVYIGSKPKAGAYKITAQTKVPGKTISTKSGLATIYARVPIEFPNGKDFVLGLYDSFNIMDNVNLQSADDVQFSSVGKLEDESILAIKAGVITGKTTGLETVNMKFKNAEIAKKYGIVAGTSEYNEYVVNGVNFTFSVVDSFGINNSNITLAVKGTADLSVSTSSSNGIEWVSQDDTIAEITNQQGRTVTITAKKVGTTIITVTQEVDGIKKTATCRVTVVKSAETITLNPSSVALNIDETKMITAKLTPDNLLVGNLKWVSSDEKVVKIESANGANAIIKATGDGVAIITVINTENSIMATCKVTVYGKATGIAVYPKDPTVNVASKNLQLIAEITPTTTVPPELSWISSDESVATVNENGLVTLKKSGKARITAFVKNTQVSGSTEINVIKSVENLKLEATSKVMYVGEKYKLGYTLTPADAVNQKINWKSTKPSVATVDSSGNVIAVSVGETVIIAQSDDGRYTDYCTIQVKQVAKNIKITTKDVTIYKGDVYDIKYTTDPVSATEVTVRWESMNTAVATVTQSGKVTGVSVGSTIILAKTTSEEISYCNITVLEKATGLKLNYNEKTVYKDKTFTLTASMIPETATNRNVKYVSSDTSIATVTSKGVVKGVKPGVTLITVTSEEGGFKETCLVTVKELITKITLNHTSYSVGLNQSFTLKPTVTSNASTNKKVKYTSSNASVVYVNASGKVTGRKIGTARITVTATDGSGARAVCTVRVVRATTNIKLNRTIMSMVVGQSTRLTATITPKNATYKTVIWSSSDPSVARILADGTITGLSPGETVITAKSRDNNGLKSAKCYVTVKEAVPSTGVTITTKNPVLIVNEKTTARAAFTPYNSTDSIVWESDNSAVVSINRTSGTITAKRPGLATITAVTSSGKLDTTTVTVVGLNQSRLTLQQYDTAYLSEVSGAGNVTWYSENPSVVTVQNGYVIARRQGSTRIVATVRGRKIYCTVKVNKIS